MFYHQYVYVRKGNLAKVWLAAHMIRKVSGTASVQRLHRATASQHGV